MSPKTTTTETPATSTPAAAAEALKDQGVVATTEPGADGSPVPPVPDDDKRDRVAMTSLRADGSPDQTPDHEVLTKGGDASAEERRAAHPRGERNVAPPGGETR